MQDISEASFFDRAMVQKGPEYVTRGDDSTKDDTSDNEEEGYTLISWGEISNPYYIPGRSDALTPPPGSKQGTTKHPKPMVRFFELIVQPISDCPIVTDSSFSCIEENYAALRVEAQFVF